MQLTSDQITKLQDLSAIKLSHEEEQVFFDKLWSIIEFLAQLKQLDLTDISLDDGDVWHYMETVHGLDEFSDSEALLHNVEHELINNSIVVKSSLD